jgi:class 3 adenylate cyclase
MRTVGAAHAHSGRHIDAHRLSRRHDGCVDGPADPPQPAEEVLAALGALGLPDEAVKRAVARGDPEGAIFDAVLLGEIAERTVSAAEIERDGGLSAEDLRAFIAAFGLRPVEPHEPAFTPEEAGVFVQLGRLEDIWPPELDVRLGRVWGPLLARIAQHTVQLFRDHVETPLLADDPDRLAGLRAVQSAFERLLPLADPVLVGVHRRWVEHELAQAAVSEAEASSGAYALPGAVSVAFLFCDLKDFTAYADVEGDGAAIAAVDSFAEMVARERGEESRLMKSLGDGVMLAYGDATPAVEAGARIIADVRAATPLRAHASVHQGVAIARDGDYFGGTVNLAARLLGTARRDELIATRPVVERTAGSCHWQAIGSRAIRGVAQPVEVFRLL